MTTEIDLGCGAGMGEDVVEAHLAESQLTVIGVGAEILQRMQALAEIAQGFAEVALGATSGILPSMVDAPGQALFNIHGAGIPVAPFVGDVVLHAGLRVDVQLDLADGRTEPGVMLASVFIVGVVLGVTGGGGGGGSARWVILYAKNSLDMLLRAINAQPLGCNLEFLGCKAKSQERENPNQHANGIRRETLQGPHIQSLGAGTSQPVEVREVREKSDGRGRQADSLIAQPVTKINAFDHGGGPFVALETDDGLEHILDVAMSPVLAFDGGDGGDVWRAQG